MVFTSLRQKNGQKVFQSLRRGDVLLLPQITKLAKHKILIHTTVIML